MASSFCLLVAGCRCVMRHRHTYSGRKAALARFSCWRRILNADFCSPQALPETSLGGLVLLWLRAIYSVLTGIISDATAALAKDRPALINITIRNPKTNAWEIETRTSAAVSESRPEGRSRPASLISFD
jgi:hypothetical protein